MIGGGENREKNFEGPSPGKNKIQEAFLEKKALPTEKNS